ncbi:MAG: LysR family transcriptional regulator [Bdellovibrionota bacterium]
MLPSSTDIVNFIEVSKTENLSRAAERLGLTQPSISLSVKRLEENIGVPLLTRFKNGVKLTQAGRKFLNGSRLVLENWKQLRADTLKSHYEISGEVSLGCHPSVALYTLNRFLPKLLIENSELTINLQHDLSRKIAEEVISLRLDLGIVVNPVNHPELVIHKLCQDQVGFWKLTSNSFEKNILIYDPNLQQSSNLLKKLKKNPKFSNTFMRHIHSSNLEVIKNLASSGIGVAILPERVAKAGQSNNLSLLSKSAPTFSDQVCLIHRADLTKTQAVKAVIQAIKQATY